MESMVTSPASPNNGMTTGGFPAIEPDVIISHLANILDITLGATRKDLEQNGSLLAKAKLSETTSRVARFATESQVALYIQKDAEPADDTDGDLDAPNRKCLKVSCGYLLTSHSIGKLCLHPRGRYFVDRNNRGFDRSLKTAEPFRSHDTHIFTNTNR